ncbi:hypothetical protein DL771_005790 [Monosporascus sp. 5C6A]|nr:hypothetical protein DL771_005790 [Monosporascus sp. 5C6A]
MIDFGSAQIFDFGSQELKDRLATHPNEGNVFDMGRVGSLSSPGMTVPACRSGRSPRRSTPSAGTTRPYPSLDGKLRLLIARCVCARDAAQHQPSVRGVLDAADDAARNRGADFYANNNQDETDANIVGIVQDLMLDADVDPAMLLYEHLEPDPIRFKPGAGFADVEEQVDDHLEPGRVRSQPGAGFAGLGEPATDGQNSESSDSEQEHIFPLNKP